MSTLDTNKPAPALVERSLDELAKLIKAEHTAVISTSENIETAKKTADKAKLAAVHQANVVSRAIKAGELLKEAKLKVAHGQWLSWLKANCALPERTTVRYMPPPELATPIATTSLERESRVTNGVMPTSATSTAPVRIASFASMPVDSFTVSIFSP